MINELSQESKNTITTGMFIWLSMFVAQFIYLFVCYYLLKEGLFKATLNPKILDDIVFMNINIHTFIYFISFTILIGGYLYFNKSYSKLVSQTQEKNFKDADEEFKYFNAQYLTLMFLSLAIFEIIAIIGIIVFLTTLNFTMATNLIVISIIGFLLVMPSKSKFNSL